MKVNCIFCYTLVDDSHLEEHQKSKHCKKFLNDIKNNNKVVLENYNNEQLYYDGAFIQSPSSPLTPIKRPKRILNKIIGVSPQPAFVSSIKNFNKTN